MGFLKALLGNGECKSFGMEGYEGKNSRENGKITNSSFFNSGPQFRHQVSSILFLFIYFPEQKLEGDAESHLKTILTYVPISYSLGSDSK